MCCVFLQLFSDCIRNTMQGIILPWLWNRTVSCITLPVASMMCEQTVLVNGSQKKRKKKAISCLESSSSRAHSHTYVVRMEIPLWPHVQPSQIKHQLLLYPRLVTDDESLVPTSVRYGFNSFQSCGEPVKRDGHLHVERKWQSSESEIFLHITVLRHETEEILHPLILIEFPGFGFGTRRLKIQILGPTQYLGEMFNGHAGPLCRFHALDKQIKERMQKLQ